MKKPSKYNEYRAKAKKWDKLIKFLGNENHITDTIPITPDSLLRMNKGGELYKAPGKKMLAGLDILGNPL